MPDLRHLPSRRPGSAQDMAPTYAQTRVTKRLAATQPGAIKLAQRYGAALVCVRYRRDADGRHRYTTVELVVDQAPIAEQWVHVHIAPGDARRQRLAHADGAQWDDLLRLWYMPRRTAKGLGLAGQITKISGRAREEWMRRR